MKPKPGEWPPPIVPTTPPMDPEIEREGKNRRLRERRLQAKERGLCTKCQREHAKPNKARCEQCCKNYREYLAGKGRSQTGPECRRVSLPHSHQAQKARSRRRFLCSTSQTDRSTAIGRRLQSRSQKGQECRRVSLTRCHGTKKAGSKAHFLFTTSQTDCSATMDHGPAGNRND